MNQNNTRAGPKIQSRWWKGKEKAHVNAAFYQQMGRRAFITRNAAPTADGSDFTWRRSLWSGQDLRAAHCPGPPKASNRHERETDSNGKFLCWQKHMQLWSCLQQVITKAWEIHLALSQIIWFIINNNNVHHQKMQSRLLMVEALGKKKQWSSYNILKLIPYISAF